MHLNLIHLFIGTNLWTYLYMNLYEREKSFIKIPTVLLLLITQGDIQSMEQQILSAKVKPDRPIQNFD